MNISQNELLKSDSAYSGLCDVIFSSPNTIDIAIYS